MSEDDRQLYVEYDINGQKFKGQGHPDDLNKHVALYASMVAPQTESGSFQLKLPEVFDKGINSAPQIPSQSAPLKVEAANSNVTSATQATLHGLVQLYQKTQLNSQREELLLITYFYLIEMGKNEVSLSDYREAYSILADIPVLEPANYTSYLGRNVEAKLLRTPSKGIYKLTIKGKEVVEKWLEAIN